jgi:hypothetical protein
VPAPTRNTSHVPNICHIYHASHMGQRGVLLIESGAY